MSAQLGVFGDLPVLNVESVQRRYDRMMWALDRGVHRREANAGWRWGRLSAGRKNWVDATMRHVDGREIVLSVPTGGRPRQESLRAAMAIMDMIESDSRADIVARLHAALLYFSSPRDAKAAL